MKISYETHYRSQRSDGRHKATMAAWMERMRRTEALLAMPKECTAAQFAEWQQRVREKALDLLALPERTPQPKPVRLHRIQREGYAVEKWEFYPDAYTAVPFLMLIPDTATAAHPAPGEICLPGSIFSKEFLAGEPLLNAPTCTFSKYPDRNRMALYMVQNGMVAFAFDNPETAERALPIEREGDYGGTSRVQLSYGLIQMGFSYPAITVYEQLQFLPFIHTLPFVDGTRLAVSAHSLGCDPAMYLGLLCDDIRAIVFNDFVLDEKQRYFATTEYDETRMSNYPGNWHELPGIFRWFSRPDVLSALAPKYLALNEGGADYALDQIKRAYALNGASDRLQITYYPKYQSPEARKGPYAPPQYGLSEEAYFAFANCDAPDHSFREAPSVALLKKAFRLS